MTMTVLYQRVASMDEDEEEEDHEDRYDKDSIDDDSDNERRDESDENDEFMDSDEESNWEGSSLDSNKGWEEAVVCSAWRQHVVAVLIALIATACTSYWQQYQMDLSSSSFSDEDDMLLNLYKHEHLHNYRRTANISFCGRLLPQPPTSRLALMDFHVQKDLIRSLEYHYEADAMEDDSYDVVFGPEPRSVKDAEYHCLRQLANSGDNLSFIRGMAYHYQTPSYAEMYPDIHKAYENRPDHKKKKPPQPAHLSFSGFGAKFVNLSPRPVLLYWDGKGGHADSARLVGEIAPFDSLGTATTPGQSFSVTPVFDSSHALSRWVLTPDAPIMTYEPENLDLTPTEQILYDMQKLNTEYAKHYLIASKRVWLSQFPRPHPVQPMHAADFVGQRYTIPTMTEDDDDERRVRINLQMEVVSVTPRVFTIEHFLSDEECDYLIQTAVDQGLQGSTLYAGGKPQRQRDVSTRSSQNAWVGRATSSVTDHIYRRAARVLQMNHTMLQLPQFVDEDASHHSDATVHSVAESLQVVRYKVGEEYTAHHDFVYPPQRHRYQPTRYATLLMYLNDDFEGGETNFPRAVNPSHHEGITITPKKGMGVLFYNMLPDGNVDDLSQHKANPVMKGEKWLANLWVWDPVIN